MEREIAPKVKRRLYKDPSPFRDLRKAANMSQVQLAEATGVSQTLISAIETRERGLTYPAAVSLAAVLGEGVYDLVGTSEDPWKGYMSLEDAGKTMNPPEDDAVMRRLCASGRIPGAKKELIDGYWRWKVPEGFRVTPTGRKSLSARKKNTIARRYLAGETGRKLADEYGIDPSYPVQLLKRGYPKIES